jgi:hypothetical protein
LAGKQQTVIFGDALLIRFTIGFVSAFFMFADHFDLVGFGCHGFWLLGNQCMPCIWVLNSRQAIKTSRSIS